MNTKDKKIVYAIARSENGKISESGTHDELVARGGSYARMHAIQSAAASDKGIA